MNFAGNLSGIVTPIAIGFIVKATGSFGWALGLISLFAIAGVLCYLLLLGEVKRIELDDDAPGERVSGARAMMSTRMRARFERPDRRHAATA